MSFVPGRPQIKYRGHSLSFSPPFSIFAFYGDGQEACELMKHNTQYQEELHNYLPGPLRENQVRCRIIRNSLAFPKQRTHSIKAYFYLVHSASLVTALL